MKSSFALVIFFNCAAIALLSIGFFLQHFTIDVAKNVSSQSFEDVCDRVESKLKLKNLILVVLDAFRDEFFFKYNAMRHIRKLVNDGGATAFRAQVYYPTVTMPRIKSILSGSISSYSDLIMNFASRQFAGENVLTMAKAAGKRVLFYGDDTWLSMLPNDVFEARSEGVSSFYVTDYTEVDNNVTRHLDFELSPAGIETWDVMALHYLGLDHVGHSIGGDNAQIYAKLNEMDRILYAMTRRMAAYRTAAGEFAVVVLGDHGMTLDGGHGGSSEAETLVPVVIIQGLGTDGRSSNNDKEFNGDFLLLKESESDVSAVIGEIEPTALIEQIDIAPTLCSLLDLSRPPASNLGISFYSRITDDWRDAAAKFCANIWQFQQYFARLDRKKDEDQKQLDVCLEKTTSLCRRSHVDNDAGISNVKALFADCEAVMRRIQREVMDEIITANEAGYVPISITLSALVFLTFIIYTFGIRLQRLHCDVFLLVFIHPILLFSSSYVEQEQDIWYFLFPLFLLKILWDESVLFHEIFGRMFYRQKFWTFIVHERWPLTALVLSRLGHAASDRNCRRWLLFAKEKMFDIGIGQLSIDQFHGVFGTAVFSDDFKIFAAATAILIQNLAFVWRNIRLLRIHCVPAAVGFLAVFSYKLPIETKMPYVVHTIQLSLACLFLARNFLLAFSLYVVFLMRPVHLPLYLLCWALGFCVGRVRLSRANDAALLLLAAVSSAFYYMGNAISVASIDIAPGYVGVPFYIPVVVAVQILINTYAGPICVLIGWYAATLGAPVAAISSSGAGHVNDVLPVLLAHRCATLLAVLTASYHFRHHLFVWTVFTPRLLFEVVHFSVLSLFIAGVLIFAPKHNVKRRY